MPNIKPARRFPATPIQLLLGVQILAAPLLTLSAPAAAANPPTTAAANSAKALCAAQTVRWTVGGNACDAAAPATTAGRRLTVNDSVAPTTGTASFACDGGQWGAPSGAVCNSTGASTPPLGTVSFSETPPERTSEPFARFAFAASGAAGFECALDGESFRPCASPLQLPRLNANRQYDRLAVGTHQLQVRALDRNGSASAAATQSWTVTSIFAAGSDDFTAKRLIDGQVMPLAATTGGWKGIMRINCEFDHAAYDDPLQLPGKPGASVLNMFFGGKNVDSKTTVESLTATTGAGCSGSTLNRSAYWMPALLAPKYNHVDGKRALDAGGAPVWEVVKPKVGEGDRSAAAAHEVFYYSAAVSNLNSIWAAPLGLRMVAGNAATTPDGVPQSTSVARWHCQSWGSSDAAGGPWSATIPECRMPDMLRFDVFFPSCWNGVDLDSPNHKDHMAYPVGSGANVTCPATHPYPLVRLSYHFAYPLFPGQLDPVTKTSKGFRLASDLYTVDGNKNNGGLSLHGVWMNGWHPEAMDLLLKGCLRGKRDCHDGNFATTSSGTAGATWTGSLSLGGLEAAKGTGVIPTVVNQGRGKN